MFLMRFPSLYLLASVSFKRYQHNQSEVFLLNFTGTSLSDLNPTVMENPECEGEWAKGEWGFGMNGGTAATHSAQKPAFLNLKN